MLEDNDVLHMVGGGYGIYNTAQADVETAVPRTLQLLEVEVDQIMKVCPLLPQSGCTCGAPGVAWPYLEPGAGWCSGSRCSAHLCLCLVGLAKGCEADRPVAWCMCVCV